MLKKVTKIILKFKKKYVLRMLRFENVIKETDFNKLCTFTSQSCRIIEAEGEFGRP